jgi:glutamyl-tRNA synthetase
MHLGNASSALLAWMSIRARSGTMVLRMEDLDLPRVRHGSADRIVEDLEWLGLDWDEGPIAQSGRFHLYDEAFLELKRAGRVYPCFCSRKDVAALASAPQKPGDELPYPGTCRNLAAGQAGERIARGDRHVWRFRVDADHAPPFRDLVYGDRGGPGVPPPGDFIVRRYDGTSSYHLAVTVDDMKMGISEVVRGDDLLPSSSRQILLFRTLGGEPPVYGHVPLILGRDGARLSKRHRGLTVRELRENGWSPDRLIGEIACMTGIRPVADPVAAAVLAERFSLGSVRPSRSGIMIRPPFPV